MNIDVLNGLRNLHKARQAESNDLRSQIQVLDDKRMSSGTVLTPELVEIGQQIESLFNKKSKVDSSIRSIHNDIIHEVLKD